RSRRLVEAGYHAQVRVAANSTLLFFFQNGQRAALHFENGQFITAAGQSYSTKELAAIAENQPELLSPNALLRPVMQDLRVPTVADVGGPSEIVYLAQAAPLYSRMLGRMPVIFPRASFTVLDAASNRLLGKYGLSLLDLFTGRQALREKMAAR